MEKIDESEMLVKPPKVTKRQIIAVVIVALCALLLIGGIITIFVVNFNKTRPPKVEFYDADGVIFAKAVANDNFYGYNFKFDDGTNKLVFSSDDALLNVSECEGLILGLTYQVSVCYKGEVEGANSEYGPESEFTMYRYLATPQVTVDVDKLTWQAVDGADYYMVNVPNHPTQKVDTNTIGFSDLPVGQYSVQVVAYSNHAYLKPSQSSAKVSVTVVHKLLPFDSVSYTAQTHKLTIKGQERLLAIDVEIDGQTYTFDPVFNPNLFQILTTTDGFTFILDLSPIGSIDSATKIGAKPTSSANGLIVFDGDYMYAEIE